MITQIVIYTPYNGNPDAARRIVELAKTHLGAVPGTDLRVGFALPSTRTVVISNDKVIKATTWASEAEMQAYFAHPSLQTYVREVLKGWRLEGDTNTPEAAQRFFDHVLSGKAKVEWYRNMSIPPTEVVWQDEQIVIYEW